MEQFSSYNNFQTLNVSKTSKRQNYWENQIKMLQKTLRNPLLKDRNQKKVVNLLIKYFSKLLRDQ